MKKQNYAARGFLFIALSLTTLTLAFAEETITITTYYPSPYGSYYNLTASNNVTLANVTGSRVGIGTATPG
ncbi:MAG: hypothetical protein KJ722_04575, partial [Candidatus Omnitrophica bacterium]|nr:hypothetical protein [Candidatus Omnitrophota bacterium]